MDLRSFVVVVNFANIVLSPLILVVESLFLETPYLLHGAMKHVILASLF